MLPRYTPQQLCLTAHAFGEAGLQDKRLFIEVARLLEPRLAEVSPTDLVRLVEAFANTEVCHYTLLTRISAQLQVRVQQATEGTAPVGATPTFQHLVKIAGGFAALKLQDYSYLELCSYQTEHLLREGRRGPTPPALAALCGACSRLKVTDTRLFESVLKHVSQHWYDYPASAMAEIGCAVAPSVPEPMKCDFVQEAYGHMFGVIKADCDMLSLRDVARAACFMAEVQRNRRDSAPGVEQALSSQLLALRNETKECFDVGRVVEVFAFRRPDDSSLFSSLCRHVHRHLGIFEPMDFVRFSRGLSKTTYRDARVVHALSKWAAKRSAEFSPNSWNRFTSALTTLGADAWRVEKLQQLTPVLQDVQSARA
jgi:hypothetical protein